MAAHVFELFETSCVFMTLVPCTVWTHSQRRTGMMLRHQPCSTSAILARPWSPGLREPVSQFTKKKKKVRSMCLHIKLPAVVYTTISRKRRCL